MAGEDEIAIVLAGSAVTHPRDYVSRGFVSLTKQKGEQCVRQGRWSAKRQDALGKREIGD